MGCAPRFSNDQGFFGNRPKSPVFLQYHLDSPWSLYPCARLEVSSLNRIVDTEIDNIKFRGYIPHIMRFFRRTNWLQFIAVLVFLCFVGQGVTAELEHLDFIHSMSHYGVHSEESNVPDEDSSAQHEYVGHHHHSDMLSVTVELPFSLETVSSFRFPESRCQDGPVFGIEYPPQLS